MNEDLIMLEGDGCYTIVNKSSIIFNIKKPELKMGESVKYLWPEEAAVKKTFTGKIVAFSSHEDELLKLREEMLNADRKTKTKKRKIENPSANDEAFNKKQIKSSPHTENVLKKLDDIIRLNKQLTVELEEFREVIQNTELTSNATGNVLDNEFQQSETLFIVDKEEGQQPKPLPMVLRSEPKVIESSLEKPMLPSASPSRDMMEDDDLEKYVAEGIGMESDDLGNTNKTESIFVFVKDTAGNKAEELMPNSNVYIEKSSFRDIKKKATSQTSLARFLMCSIFTQKALQEHKLPGINPKEDEKGICLPLSVVNTILLYASEKAKSRHWTVFDNRTVRESLRSKLKELKKKGSKKKSLSA